MHKVIYLVVRAESEKEAWAKGMILRDKLTDNNNYSYDYGCFFTDEDSSQVSGKGRWGNLVPIAKLDSKDGKKHLDNGLANMRSQFMEALQDAKDTMEKYTPEEIYEGKVTDPKSKIIEALKDKGETEFKLFMFRYRLQNMCDNLRYGWVYILEEESDQSWVSGVDGHIDFDNHIQGYDRSKLWIMPMDVHF